MYTVYMYTLFLLLDFGCAQILEDSHQGYCMRGDAKAGTVHYNPSLHWITSLPWIITHLFT